MIRKTALATALSVSGIVLAGGAAIGASVGILNAADDNQLGQLSGSELAAATTSSTIAPAVVTAQTFGVDAVGEVRLVNADGVLTIAEVSANDGWTWAERIDDDGSVVVVFTSDSDSLEFHARAGSTGQIEASLERPGGESVEVTPFEVTTSQTSSPATTAPPSTTSSTVTTSTSSGSTSTTWDDHDDEYEDDDHDEYEDEDDHDEDDDHDEYEDDDHEYEGGDDDD